MFQNATGLNPTRIAAVIPLLLGLTYTEWIWKLFSYAYSALDFKNDVHNLGKYNPKANKYKKYLICKIM